MSIIRLLALLIPLVAGVPTLHAQTDLGRVYTDDRPLVYEDAWDLWPYVFLDDEGNPTGYNVDLLKLIFDKLNIPYVIRLKPTHQALEDLREGRSDLMLGMKANFHDDYTLHYGKNVIHLFTHSLAHSSSTPPSVTKLADLATNKVIVHSGSFSHHLMEDHGWGDNAMGYGDMDKAIQMISAEGQGQVLWNAMSLKWLIHKYHADNLTLTPVDMPSGDYRFMSNDEELLKQLDQVYAQLDANEQLKPLQEKWFHPERQTKRGAPGWLWYVALAIGAVALLLTIAALFSHIQQRKATRQLRQRNNLLSQILSISHVSMWTYNVKHDVFTWYGTRGNAEKKYSSQEFARLYHPSDYHRLAEAINKVASQQQDEVQLQLSAADTADGQEHTYRVFISVLRKEHGIPSVIIGTKADITEEYRRQQETEALTQRYKSVFSTAMVDMVYFDKDGYINNLNERASQTFHMSLDDMRQHNVNLTKAVGDDDLHLDSTERVYLSLCLDASNKNLSMWEAHQDNTDYYELQLVPVFDANHHHVGTYGTGRHITEFVKTFHKAQQGVKRLRQATNETAEHVDNINFALKVGGVRLISYSPTTHLLTIFHRMHEAQYVLTQQRCLSMLDAESVHAGMRMLRAMDSLAYRSMDCDLRTNLRLPDGKRLTLQLHLFPSVDEQGCITKYSGICRDTTDIKHTEQLLQQETIKAQEVEQVKSQFLHNMCYEIRTPLNTVVAFAEKFEQEHKPEDEELYIQEIKDKSAHLLQLINDILFLSRLDAHMITITPQPIDFAMTFEAHCQAGWGAHKQQGVNYVVKNKYDQLVVDIDDTNLGHVIELIAAASAMYTPHGSVKARYEHIGGKLIIVFDDTGVGIDPETLSHIFDRFNMMTGQSKSSGLGMAICQELTHQMGGTIEINSEVGKGTSVWITIPCNASVVEHKKEQ